MVLLCVVILNDELRVPKSFRFARRCFIQNSYLAQERFNLIFHVEDVVDFAAHDVNDVWDLAVTLEKNRAAVVDLT